MATDQAERPQFFEGQYLGAADLAAAVDYARFQQARHRLGAHTWGIAVGLRLCETDNVSGGVDVTIEPGYAVDGFGQDDDLALMVLVVAVDNDVTFDGGALGHESFDGKDVSPGVPDGRSQTTQHTGHIVEANSQIHGVLSGRSSGHKDAP